MGSTIDLHCHPSLKTWLFGRSLERTHATIADPGLLDAGRMYVDLPKMRAAGVRAAFSAVHIPERAVFEYCTVADLLEPLFDLVLPRLSGRFEQNDTPDHPFLQTIEVLEHFAAEIRRVSATDPSVTLATSFPEFEQALTEGRTVFVQTVEGGHSLGRGLPRVEDYVANLDVLADRGVAMLTLAHLFPNELCGSVEGLPGRTAAMLDCRYRFDPASGLTEIGEAVVERMIERGVVVDLTHATPRARTRIFELNARRRPMVFSHAGVAALNPAPMNPTDDEIARLAECDGVIGVIFMNYWLTGQDEPILTRRPGLQNILRTIQHIRQVTGSYRHVCIGTDFDGLGDPPDDLQDISKLGVLRDALERELAMSPDDIDAVMGGNILRVMKHGWTVPVPTHP